MVSGLVNESAMLKELLSAYKMLSGRSTTGSRNGRDCSVPAVATSRATLSPRRAPIAKLDVLIVSWLGVSEVKRTRTLERSFPWRL